MSDWISVDTPPKNADWVMIFPDGLRDSRVSIGAFLGQKEWVDMLNDTPCEPTHWKPINKEKP